MSSESPLGVRYWRVKPRIDEEFFTFEWRMGVPGIQCDRCGTWATMGPMLPSVTMEGSQWREVFRSTSETGPLSIDRWRRMAAMLQPSLPPGQAVTPGLMLGPIHGRVRHEFEIGWIALWGIVANAAVTEDVRTVAPELVAVAAQFANASKRYYEWELRTAGSLANVAKESTCPVCGRVKLGKIPKDGLRIKLTEPNPIFRLTELPTYMVVNDSVREILEKYARRQLEFTEIEVELG